MSSKSLPKPIAAIIAREAELQAGCDRWSVAAFRAERDRLEAVIRSGSATDAEIEAHAASRDGGKVDADYQTMSASSQAALDAHRRTNWQTFRAFLLTRLESRRERERVIDADVQALRDSHGIAVDYSDPQEATTNQLAHLCESEDVGYIRFGDAAATF